ncbi:c-type cytochrome [Microvirga arsenatis]|uniref:C-type cytochrome n=1 Tax=Microvirga arsenatis TaxID=2692265 RepID=A0ABW9Z150_9HYPH|nr:cytochrome c [Microvirga arsenatis]NBJ10723.1 c-type cytochrome [Microvirga arsenatis]NBJ24379.1 c-type cytochrome [Microvirga arsenatis]
MKRLALLCTALALGSSAVMAQSGRVQRGLTFAQTNCSQCHAIGHFGDSPIPEAPPFRTLHTLYPIEGLAEAFAEGITTGHPSMPQFELDPAQINDLLAYLQSIQG